MKTESANYKRKSLAMSYAEEQAYYKIKYNQNMNKAKELNNKTNANTNTNTNTNKPNKTDFSKTLERFAEQAKKKTKKN